MISIGHARVASKATALRLERPKVSGARQMRNGASGRSWGRTLTLFAIMLVEASVAVNVAQ
jgi:hypothetical protein